MGKYIAQFAVQGVLFLVGVGVDVMPGNTSWIPSVIIWGVAFLWLIVTIVYYIKHRRKTAAPVKEPTTKLGQPSLSVGNMLGLTRAHICSKCGWGTEVSMWHNHVTCPQCENVDNVKNH